MRVLIAAGEPSGDAHAAKVVPHLRAAGFEIEAVGGPALAAAGARLVQSIDDLSVIGVAEVVTRLPRLRALHARLVTDLRKRRWDVLLGVDYPGFNLRLEASAQRAGVPVVHYIGPQVWAWRAHRLAVLRRHVTQVALILPFEKPLYEAAGVPATFVGHPLLEDDVPADIAVDHDLALFPGSRAQEITRHLPVLLGAARTLQRARPNLRILLSCADAAHRPRMEAALSAHGFDESCITEAPARVTLRRARAALVKSGTTTLEAALAGCPFAVLYRTSALTFAIVRRLVRVPHAALANLVAGREIVREYLQDRATPELLAAEAARLLDDEAERGRIVDACRTVRARLGEPGASQRVAQLTCQAASVPWSAG